jgi:hypothetical protein
MSNIELVLARMRLNKKLNHQQKTPELTEFMNKCFCEYDQLIRLKRINHLF